MAAASKLRPPDGRQILDEAIYLLRSAWARLLPLYYIGSLPFVLAALYFWADMSRAADASRYHGISSLGVALLYVWMKCWQAIFAARARGHLLGGSPTVWTARRVTGLIAAQSLLHSTGFFLLPVAAVLVLPFGWCYAFYQNLTAAPVEKTESIAALWRYAWRQAALWPGQNHLLVGVMTLFSGFVFLNLAVAVFITPYLIKKFSGAETVFTLSGINALNTTFWAAVFALAYLCLDPIVKIAYVLRCFYGDSLSTGSDIKRELARCVSRRHSTPSSY